MTNLNEFICKDCGNIFEIPDTYHERNIDFGNYTYIQYHICPNCKSTNYTNAVECDLCHQHIERKFVQLDNDMRVCDNCYVTKSIGEL